MASIDDSAGGQGDSTVLLGKNALDRGWITPVQLRAALVEQAKDVRQGSAHRSLGRILLEKGYLDTRQVAELLDSGKEIPPEPALPPGAAILGKYVLLQELGRGGMGVVQEAVDSTLNRRVALKMLPESAELQDVERFLQEARLSAKLPRHDHIVSVYEAGEIDGRRFIAMELVRGSEFGKWRKKGPASLRDQVDVLRAVAQAVHHAHVHGVIHRDLKPSNILVDGEGAPHVMDFGLAKKASSDGSASLTVSGTVLGTPTYMSPEQAQGLKGIDRRTDVYSLGVILYEILAGRPPFRGESAVEIIMKIVRDPLTPPSELAGLRGNVPFDADIEAVCMKALAKDPRRRFATAKQLADDLGRWLRRETVAARAPARGRWIPALAAGGAGLLAILLFLAFRPAPRKMPAEPEPAFERPSPRPPSAEAVAAERKEARRRLLESWHRKADDLLAKGSLEDAIAAYALILAEDPEDAKAKAGREAAEARRKPILPPPAPPPARPAAFLEIVLGPGGRSDGLRVVDRPDGKVEPLHWAGKTCVKLVPGARINRDFYLDVPDRWLGPGQVVEIEVEYYDAESGGLHVEYDSMAGPYRSTGPRSMGNSRTWKTARWTLKDAKFMNGQAGVSDFRIETLKAMDLYIHRIRLNRLAE